jgi:oligopeptidase B
VSSPPRAKIVPRTLESFGEVRVDEYAWLRERSDPHVLEYLTLEKEHAEAVLLERTGDLQRALYEEMRGRIQETDQTVPVREADFHYYSRTQDGQEYAIHCRRRVTGEGSATIEGPEEILIDENELARPHEYFSLAAYATSEDHRWLAYATDTSGDEIHQVRIKNLDTGELLAEVIDGAGGSLAWGDDHRTLFYTVLDEAHRPYRAMRHARGEDPSTDVLVYEEEDEAFFLGLYRSRSDRYIVLSLASQITTETRLIPANAPESEPWTFAQRSTKIEYGVAHGPDATGDRFFVLTNDDAVNFRLLEARMESGPSGRVEARERWREVIPHRSDTLLEDVDVFSRHIVLWERFEGVLRIRVIPRASLNAATDDPAAPPSLPGKVVDFPDPAYSIWSGSNPSYETDRLRFGYCSMTTPSSVFDYDLERHTRKLLKRQVVVGGHDKDAYHCERLFATAPDGSRIPISLVYKKDPEGERGGPRPLVLYGYGAYGSSVDAIFSSSRLSLLERGVAWAIAHVRGGSEMGRHWYEEGKLDRKENTFTDFISCAEHLIAEGFTRPELLAATGGSAGGLLIGAVANRRPDLFEALVADVPFVDVLNTMLDPTLPLTVVEWEEWGNPGEEDAYRTIRGYSPYENVSEQDYPHMLILAGLNDPRVGFWEPAKWCARLRERKTDEHSLLLWTNMDAGHGGASGRFEYLHEVAMEWAFLLDRLGRSPALASPPAESRRS